MSFRQCIQRIPRFTLLYYVLLVAWLVTTGMHIPDGYLSPATSIVLYLLTLPFWARGVQRLRQKINAKNVPLIALLAAFSFVIMMFNVPLPGGTTGHAVGGALIAIVLGPEIATIAVSIALLIQALFFGDGGILAFGANCFNMAVVLPYVSYAVYRAIARSAPTGSKRSLAGAAAGGWAGLTAAAFFAAIEFGLQPLLFHAADGTPLYAPYPLSISIPAMVIPHALVASVVEGLVTALVLAYLQRSKLSALQISPAVEAGSEAGLSGPTGWRKRWALLAALALAAPLGLLAPGTAWGEWGAQELSQRGLGFVPQGLARLENLWGAPLAGYNLPVLGNATLGYVLSAVLGIVLVSILVWLLTSLLNPIKPSKSE